MSFPPHMSMTVPMLNFPAMMIRPPAPLTSTTTSMNSTPKTGNNEKKDRQQATIKVFVGGISDYAPNDMIKAMLQYCGNVVSWQRAEGTGDKIQNFGFCEYEDIDSTLRCIRLLNGFEILNKKIFVTVDAKTKVALKEYKKMKRYELPKKIARQVQVPAYKVTYEDDEEEDSNSTNTDEKKKTCEEDEIKEEDDDYIDDDTRREDFTLKQSIKAVIRTYSCEIDAKISMAKQQAIREVQEAAAGLSSFISIPLPTIVNPISKKTSTNQKTQLVDPDDEEEKRKRNLISNEIQLFRERFKDDSLKLRYALHEQKSRYKCEPVLECEYKETTTNKNQRSTKSALSSKTHTNNFVNNHTNQRDRSSSSDSSSSQMKSPISKIHSLPESAEEKFERERILRRKERQYRERLKSWEKRERKKQMQYQAEKQHELARIYYEENEGKRLLKLCKNFDDKTNDYYKGLLLSSRLIDREYEIEQDRLDQCDEQQEIEELRQKLLIENKSDNFELEIKKHLEKEEELIRKSLVDLIQTTSDISDDEKQIKEKSSSINQKKDKDTIINISKDFTESVNQSSQSTIEVESPQKDVKINPHHTSALDSTSITSTKLPSKHKLDVNEVFHDDNMNALPKKSKLSALADEQNTKISQISTSHSSSSYIQSESTSKDTPIQSQEDRRQFLRKLIKNMPRKKEDLFDYPLDWSLLDSNLMEKRIKPWIIKKMLGYLGEKEPTLTDFICTSIMSKKSPDSILADIRVILDDEAETFVINMWRLIISEIEVKRNGLRK